MRKASSLPTLNRVLGVARLVDSHCQSGRVASDSRQLTHEFEGSIYGIEMENARRSPKPEPGDLASREKSVFLPILEILSREYRSALLPLEWF